LADAAGVVKVKELPPLIHQLGKRSFHRRSLLLRPFPRLLEIGTNRILEGFVPAEDPQSEEGRPLEATR
jgi:hypothetical protein